ncbi:MAG: NADH-quinone oxidoreductase subunit NuoN [Gammaproteobacteria bacterium]|nr:NADH-quinone oxidoreductase subunit NuoN [Gammaproteobacteria bacterium]
MNFTMPNFSVALPEIFMLCMAVIALMTDVFLPARARLATYIIVQFTVVVTFFLAVSQYSEFPEQIITFGGSYIIDKLAILLKIFICFISFFVFAYSREYITERGIAFGEYYILGLLAVLGMLIMSSAYSFLTIYLGLELLSLALYAMVAMQKDSAEATEAAMKYFVMGALASGLLLYGISMIYGATGSIQLSQLADIMTNSIPSQHLVEVFGLVFILVGLLFKFGAVPFHMWVPDVYQGAPTSMTLFIASAPKIAAFGITMRILVEAMPSLQVEWQQVLIVVAILSMFFGNVLAIAQTNIKRMLAYSSIAHIGYMLLGIIAGPGSAEGYSAAMFYVITYTMVALGAFGIISILSRKGVELDQLEDYRGMNARNPWLAFMMLLLMFSMAGVPPTVGFFAKLGLLEALVEAHFVWLACLALLFAIIGAYYYLRIVMLMYFEEPAKDLPEQRIYVSPNMLAVITMNCIFVLIFGLFPSNLIDMCRISLAG